MEPLMCQYLTRSCAPGQLQPQIWTEFCSRTRSEATTGCCFVFLKSDVPPAAARTKCEEFINKAGEHGAQVEMRNKQLLMVETWSSTSPLQFGVGWGSREENQDVNNYYANHLWHHESRTQELSNPPKCQSSVCGPPLCESPQAAKRPVVSHLFTPAAAGCHWDSEGEIPWFSLPFLTAPAQTTLIRDCGRARGQTAGMDGSGPGQLNRGRRSAPGDNLDVQTLPGCNAVSLIHTHWAH